MKNKIFIAGSIIMLLTQISFAQAPIVYLPLDSDLNDTSGNGLNATDEGAVATEFVDDAERGKVAYFPETAYAQLPQDDKLDFGTDDFSFAFWVKIDNETLTTDSDPSIISNKDWGSGGNAGFVLALDGAGAVGEHQWTLNAADGAGGRLDWDADDNATPNIADNTWHFVAAVFDRGSTMNLYFDGELKQTDPNADSKDLTLLTGSLTDPALNFTIMDDGTGAYNAGREFAASIDDLLIYDRVITATEVAEIYADGGYFIDPALGASVYLPFDSDLTDVSGNDLHATDEGSVATEFVNDPERGNVAFFPETAYAQLPQNAMLDFGTADFSFAFWVKIDNETLTTDSDPSIISNKDWGSGGNAGFVLALDGAGAVGEHQWTLNAADGAGGRLDWDADDNATPNLADNTWHFIAAVFDRDATMNLYFDGELKQTDPNADSKDLTLLTSSLTDPALNFTIMDDGTGNYNAGREFSAFIDDLRIWPGKALSADEVSNAYSFVAEKKKQNPAFGAAVYLPFDSDLTDASTNGLNATDEGTAATEFVNDAERGKVAYFPETAYAQLPQDDKLDFGTDDFSFAFWVKIDNETLTTDSDPSIISNKDWGSGGNAGFVLALDGAGAVGEHQWTLNAADGAGGRLDWDADDNATPNIADNTWHFVAAVFDRDATMNVYFDGELKQTDPNADSKDLTILTGSLTDPALNFTIMDDGTGNYNAGREFAAFIDDLRIWPGKVLSAAEVLEIYNFKPESDGPDLVFNADVFLPMDADLNDASGNGVNAVNGGTEDVNFVNDNERGLVAEFPIAAHAQIPFEKLDLGATDFSCSFWVKIDPSVSIPSDPVLIGNKDWGSGGNPGFLVALDGAGVVGEHLWTVNLSDGAGGRLDWDADDNDTPDLQDGKWHMVTLAVDKDEKLNVYFDAELRQTDESTDSYDMTLAPGSLSSGLPFTIMQDATGSYGADFSALIDDVRIWNGKVLTAAEVAAIYSPTDKSYEASVFLPLNSDLSDLSGNGLNASDAGSVPTEYLVDAERGDVAFFPTAAHAQLPIDDKLNFGTEDFSVAFWVKIDNSVFPNSDPVIVGNKDWGSGGNTGFLVALDGAGGVGNHLWTVNAADGAGGRIDWDADDNSTPDLVDDKWHLVAVSFDRDATMKVYYDGKLKQTDEALDSKDLTLVPGNLAPDVLPFTIMQDATGAYGADFEAYLDNVRIWNRVITDAEVLKIFNEDEGNGANNNVEPEGIVLNVENLEKQSFSVYPNPIRNGWSRFNFSLDQPSQVNLVIYNQSGMVVENQVNQSLPSGNHTIEWNASGNQSGMYYYRLQGTNIQQSGKIILVR